MNAFANVEEVFFEETENKIELITESSTLFDELIKDDKTIKNARTLNVNSNSYQLNSKKTASNQLNLLENPFSGTLSDPSLEGISIVRGKPGSFYKKVRKALSVKTATLTKYLDAYGVIHSIDVINRYKTNINARIYDVANNKFIDDISFESTEFSNSDQQKLVENAIFYWHVGCEVSFTGKKRDVSEFRLRRVIIK